MVISHNNGLTRGKPLLDAIRQMPKDPNYIDANYYYGFIAFSEKRYTEAMQSFKIVENEKTYSNIVPYYVANIYLLQGQKDKAIEYAESKLSKGNQYYDAELSQLVGHGYYEKKEFAKALPYLEKYAGHNEKVSREQLYELSYCYYQTKNWNKAIEGLKQLGYESVSLAQNAMYLLGDAYLKTDQKANARNAFSFCASNSSNDKQREISKFNYAKLSYELGYQDIALSELKSFLQQYPQSSLRDEARELMVNGSYQYEQLQRCAGPDGQPLKNPADNNGHIYARILYGRATELANDGMLLAANDLLDKALQSKNNADMLPFINFWKGGNCLPAEPR